MLETGRPKPTRAALRAAGLAAALSLAAVIAVIAVIAAPACSSFSSVDDAPSDAAADQADGANDPRSPGCDSDAWALCDDFDDPARTVWTGDYTDDGGAIAVDDAAAFSPPLSLGTTLRPPPKDPDAGCALVERYRTFEGDLAAPNGVHLESAVMPTQTYADTAIGPAVQLGVDADAAADCAYYLVSDDLSTALVEQAGSAPLTKHRLMRTLPLGKWSVVAIDIEGPAGSRTVRVAIGGAQALPPTRVAASCQNASLVRYVFVGLICVGAGPPVSYRWDDVRLGIR